MIPFVPIVLSVLCAYAWLDCVRVLARFRSRDTASGDGRRAYRAKCKRLSLRYGLLCMGCWLFIAACMLTPDNRLQNFGDPLKGHSHSAIIAAIAIFVVVIPAIIVIVSHIYCFFKYSPNILRKDRPAQLSVIIPFLGWFILLSLAEVFRYLV